uniref:J domain-containing protein n=1 Tax=Nymphaea colorata TaxID=210225 RepID=A0A5K1B6D7_9MAGN
MITMKFFALRRPALWRKSRKPTGNCPLKFHPDKNKAPGADEAFKIVSKAFKCLSDGELRRQYEPNRSGCQFNQQHHMRRKRRRARNDFFDEDFDPDEVFRSFFFGSQEEVFHNVHIYRARHRTREQRGIFALLYFV